MSRILNSAKTLAEKVPYSLSWPLVYVPFRIRLGSVYKRTQSEIEWLRGRPGRDVERVVFENLKRITVYAYENVPFYRYWYRRHGYHPDRLKTLDDFLDVPMTSKKIFKEYVLEHGPVEYGAGLSLNTGGSSGETLDFRVDRHAFAREWAHMHDLWKRGGYRTSDQKLTLRGKHWGQRAIRYNVVHNEWVVNGYSSPGSVVAALGEIVKKHRIRWIHGYPSLVSEFAEWMLRLNPDLLSRLRENLKGVLLASEYPAPHYRDRIVRLLSDNVVTWYGHSEMVVLAREIEHNKYEPYHSYGYCEAVGSRTTGQKLVGTSYYNTVHPFIRYDTNDLIDAQKDGRLVSSFRITQGRVGDFVERRDGSRVSLTYLFFGQHHEAYRMIDHVQVRQDKPGTLTMFVVPRRGYESSKQEIINAFRFDSAGFNIGYEFLSKPIRTERGKVSLLVQEKK